MTRSTERSSDTARAARSDQLDPDTIGRMFAAFDLSSPADRAKHSSESFGVSLFAAADQWRISTTSDTNQRELPDAKLAPAAEGHSGTR